MTQKGHDEAHITEAVGVFAGANAIDAAIAELAAAGFERAEFGLLASESSVLASLGDVYTRTAASPDDSNAPNTAFVAAQSVGDTVHAYLGTLFYAGTTVAAGAAVATAAVLGGALIAAITGAAAIATIGAALALIIHESDAEELEQQVEEGHLLLFVRVRDATHEQQAVEILRKHTPIEVKVVRAPARSSER
jgi:outer membrane lipoprotein SlyB